MVCARVFVSIALFFCVLVRIQETPGRVVIHDTGTFATSFLEMNATVTEDELDLAARLAMR
eukprot:6485688-Amphidinium_carterae.1